MEVDALSRKGMKGKEKFGKSNAGGEIGLEIHPGSGYGEESRRETFVLPW